MALQPYQGAFSRSLDLHNGEFYRQHTGFSRLYSVNGEVRLATRPIGEVVGDRLVRPLLDGAFSFSYMAVKSVKDVIGYLGSKVGFPGVHASEISSPSISEAVCYGGDCQTLDIATIQPHSDTADKHQLLGHSQHKLGNLVEAIRHFQNAKEIYEQLEAIAPGQFKGFSQGLAYPNDRPTLQNEEDFVIRHFTQSKNHIAQSREYDQLGVASIVEEIGLIFVEVGKYEDALIQFQNALKLFNQDYGESHIGAAQNHQHLGHMYRETGNKDRALEHFEQAKAIYIELEGKDSEAVGSQIESIAHIFISYETWSMYGEAVNKFKEAIRIFTEFYPQSHLSIAENYQYIAAIYGYAGTLSDDNPGEAALKALYTAKEMYTELKGKDSEYVAYQLEKIAAYLKPEEAILAELEALEIYKNIFKQGPYIKIANIYNSLGYTYQRVNGHEKSLKYFKQAKDMYAELDGQISVAVGLQIKNIAHTLVRLERLEEAQIQFEEAFETLIKCCDASPYSIAEIHADLGHVYNELGSYTSAIHQFEDAKITYTKMMGNSSTRVIEQISNIGYSFRLQKNYEKALACYEEGLNIYESYYSSDYTSCEPGVEKLREAIRLCKERLSLDSKNF